MQMVDKRMMKRQYSSGLLIKKKSKYVPFCVLRLTLEVKVSMEIEEVDKDNMRSKLRLVSSSNVSVCFRYFSHVSYAFLTCNTFI